MRKIQRRDFLKAMGLTTAALSLTRLRRLRCCQRFQRSSARSAAVLRRHPHSRKQQGRRLPPRGPLWPSSKPGN